MSKRRYMEFVNMKTGEVSNRVDVTGQSDRQVERCLRGMLINIGDDWFVRDTANNPSPSSVLPSGAAKSPTPAVATPTGAGADMEDMK
jgi:hypothetical protein